EPTHEAAYDDPSLQPSDVAPTGESTGKHAADRHHGSFLRELPILIAVALILALLIKQFLVQAFYIPSESMENTLHVGDRVLVNKLSYHLHDVHHGDIVVFKRPPAEAGEPAIKDLIKRVIGLPGDTSESRDGVVYVND